MRIVLLTSLFILCVISTIWAYQMNYETRAKKKQILEVTKKINFTLTRIELLRAEWAFLNSPERLSKLVDENFPKGFYMLSNQEYSSNLENGIKKTYDWYLSNVFQAKGY